MLVEKKMSWIRRRPSALAIVLALVLLGLGQLFNTYGVLGPLARFTSYVERSLRSFDALTISNTFYRELTGCELGSDGVACEPGPDTTDTLAGRPQNGLLGTVLAAVINTVTDVFGEATWLGIVFWLVFLAAAGFVTATVLDLEESGPVGIVLLIILTPALASVSALAFKWLLLVLILLFSQVLAGIMFFVTTFGTLIAWLNAGNTVLSTAHSIDTFTASASNTPPPDPPPA